MRTVKINLSRVWMILMGAIFTGYSAQAQLPTPRLTSVYPPGGKAGTTVEVTVAGQELDEASRLFFSMTNITATPKTGTNGVPEANKFLVTIPARVPPAVCDVHVVGRFGISNPRAFVIGGAAESIAPTTNSAPGSAGVITVNSVVNGRATANAEAWFSFAAKKGQRLLIDCQSREIDSRMEDVLVLLDDKGQELARNRKGGLLDFTAPTTGDYRLKIHDFTFRGGDDYFYRLSVSTGPHVDFVHPLAGVPGSTVKGMVYGRNLPGGVASEAVGFDGKPLQQLQVEIEFPKEAAQRLESSAQIRPADTILDGFDYRLKTPSGISNPVWLSFASAPVVAGKIRDEAVPKAEKLTVPAEYVGRFAAKGQATPVVFEAKKGEVYWVEVFSQRLGYPADPFALIERVTKNDKGVETFSTVQEMYDSDQNLGGMEFNTVTRDPAYRLEAKEDGMYRISVRDLFNRTAGAPRYFFRLAVRKETPDFRLVAMAVQPPKPAPDSRIAHAWTSNLRRRETQTIKVLAVRRDGFNGAIQLNLEGLPNGLSAGPAVIEAGKTTALIPITAKEDVSAWAGNVRITGTAKIGDATVTREARGGTVLWQVPDFNNEPVLARMTRDMTLGVCAADKAAMSIETGTNQVYEAVAGGKIKIPLRVNRHSEFLEALKLKAVGLGALDAMPEVDINNQTNSTTLEIDIAKYKLPPGKHTFFLQTPAKGSYRSYAADAQAADGDVAKADSEIAAANKAVKKATDAVAAAKKELDTAEAQRKSVSEADKAKIEERIKEAKENLSAAEKAVSGANAKVKAAEGKKTAAAAKAKEVKAKAAPKNATIMVYSAPITIEVKVEEKKTQ